MNAERLLGSHESLGDGRWFIEKASKYACERSVFGRPIGQNQGIQFPIAESYAASQAAALMARKAAALSEANEPCGAEATMAKSLAAEDAGKAAEELGSGSCRERGVQEA